MDPDDPFATPYYPYLGYGDPRYPPYAEQPYYGPYGPPRYGPSYGPPSRPYPPHYYDGGYASASDSADWARNRQLRGNQEGKDRQADENKKVESRKLKTRRRDYYYGKGSGGKGSGGKGSSGKAARPNRYAYNDPYYYEPHTYLSGEPNYYELGLEGYDVPYGWEEVGDGTLRPKCPPGKLSTLLYAF